MRSVNLISCLASFCLAVSGCGSDVASSDGSSSGGSSSGGSAQTGGAGGTAAAGGAGGRGGSGGTGVSSPGCTHPSAATLAANDGNGVSDLVFDDRCNAYLTSIVSGSDTLYVIDGAGTTTTIAGFSNLNMSTAALDPSSSNIYVAMDTNAECHVGSSVGQAQFTDVASGSQTVSSLWTNVYVNRCQSSIAMDSAGCIWVPNFDGDGTLGCTSAAGSTSAVLTGLGYIESVGLNAAETLYISVGAEIRSVNQAGKTTALFYTAGGNVLDFVFGANGDLFVEVDGGGIERRTAAGVSSTFQSKTGEGKLAISPDGWLVRVVPNPVGSATYEEWMLP